MPFKAEWDEIHPAYRQREDSTHITFNGWPNEPQKPNTQTILKRLELGGDVLLALSPIIFLYLWYAASRLDHQPLSDWGSKVELAISVVCQVSAV
jgi:hypothetical protein